MTKKPLQLHEDIRREHKIEGSSDRSFGLVFAGVFTIVAALNAWRGGAAWPWWLGGAAAFAAVALAYPAALGPANRAWLKLGLLMFKVVNPIVMLVLYVVTIVPIGLIMRATGRDPLRLRLDRESGSYWILREPPGPAPASMKNQF